MTTPFQCWRLKRLGVPEPDYILNTTKDKIKFGRRSGPNDKICVGRLVSKEHLILRRHGTTWQTLEWSVTDSSKNGTFINNKKIEQNVQVTLNHDDVVGIGCGGDFGATSETNETFVYKIKCPGNRADKKKREEWCEPSRMSPRIMTKSIRTFPTASLKDLHQKYSGKT